MNYPILKPTEIDAIGAAVFHILDAPRRKSDFPIKPVIAEFIGKPKAGKDKQLVNVERLVKRMKFQVLVHQEGAESEAIRVHPRDFSFAMQLTYLVQALDRMLHAAVSRDFHAIFLNRGVLDVLYWLEFQRRENMITQKQYDTTVNFILQGPWVGALDAVICLTVSVERALEREYGKDFRMRKVKFGRMMSPEGLTLMGDCVDTACGMLSKELPDLPLFVIDTTDQTKEETERHIASILFSEFQKRLKIGEDQILPWSIDLMREKAWESGPELKLKGTVSHERLRRLGWVLEASVDESDEFFVPRGQDFLSGGECFHLRSSGGSCYLVYKRVVEFASRRHKIPVPLSGDCIEEIRASFDPVDTVKKRREIFTRDGFVLHKDRVEILGEFVEIKGRMATTVPELITAAHELGFGEIDIVPDSYIKLKLLSKQ